MWIGHTGGDIGAYAVLVAQPDTGHGLALAVNVGGFLPGPLVEGLGESFVEELLTRASGAR